MLLIDGRECSHAYLETLETPFFFLSHGTSPWHPKVSKESGDGV
jgi:hypothetical protein